VQTSVSDREKFERLFLPLASSALAGLSDSSQDASAATHPPPPGGIRFLGAEGQPHCTGLVDLLKQSDAVIYLHEQLAKRKSPPSHVQEISTSFVGEKDMATKTIQAGRYIVSNEIEKLLADGFHDVRGASARLGTLSTEEVQRGGLLLLRGKNQDEAEKHTRGWNNIARDTERAMERLCFSSKPAA